MSTQLKFLHTKETKNKQRYDEVVPDGGTAKVGALYLDKELAGQGTELSVTIEVK